MSSTNKSAQESTEKYIEPSITTTKRSTPSKSYPSTSLKKTKNLKNAQSTKSISSPTSNSIPILSGTSTCSKRPITSTSSTNTATEAHYKAFSLNKANSQSKKHY